MKKVRRKKMNKSRIELDGDGKERILFSLWA
jgi:hypothetical protein